MQRSDDPRNIFYNQRQQFNDEATDENAKQQEVSQEQTSKNGKDNSKGSYDEKLAEMKKLAAKYEREGEGQLVKDIVNNVIEQKAAGNLTNEQLVAFAKRISPLLNAEQRTRLNGLVEQLLEL